jgi:hypothetical protein
VFVSSTSDSAVKPPPRLIDGVKLQQKLPTLSTTFRALLGYELKSGTVAITRCSPRQAAAITESPMALIRTIAAATPLDLSAMRTGLLDVETVHRGLLSNQRRTEAAVDALVIEIGLDRVLASLDRLTRPPTKGAAVRANGHDLPISANDNDSNGVALAPAQFAL